MTNNLVLRDVIEDDLAVFFQHQRDPDASFMTAFTAEDPADYAAFTAHWRKNLASETGIIKTIVVGEHVVGHVLSYEEAGAPEVSYWIDKAHWGQGIANARGTEIEEVMMELSASTETG